MSAALLSKPCEGVASVPRRSKKYLHYVALAEPYKPALCGKPAPAVGWWADALQEAKAVVNAWQICPACETKYSGLFSRKEA